MKKKNIIVLVILLFFSFYSFSQTKFSRKLLESSRKIAITKENLEKAEIFDFSTSRILIIPDGYVISENRTGKIVKFSMGGIPQKKYGHKGQGPGEFSSIRDLFFVDNKIAVIDRAKIVILDKNLNFEKEIKNNYVSNSFYLYKTKAGWLWGNADKKGWKIVFLDNNFKELKETTLKPVLKCNSLNIARSLVFFSALRPLSPEDFVYYSPFVVGEDCKVEILKGGDLKEKRVINLRIKNPVKNCKEVFKARETYFINGVAKSLHYIFVSVSKSAIFKSKSMNSNEVWYVISKNGKTKPLSFQTDYHLLSVIDYVFLNRVYLVDKDGNLAFFEE